jgi:hypothetical protein
MERFIADVHEFRGQYPRDRIVNVDETNWKAVPDAFMTWAHANTETVKVQNDDDEKRGVTAIAAVHANGGKLPLTLIGKGKTSHYLSGYHLPRGFGEPPPRPPSGRTVVYTAAEP